MSKDYAAFVMMTFALNVTRDGGVEAAMRAPVDGLLRCVESEFGEQGLERILQRLRGPSN